MEQSPSWKPNILSAGSETVDQIVQSFLCLNTTPWSRGAWR